MKKMTVLIAALFALAAPLASFAAMDHSDHGSMDMGHGGHQGDVAYAEVVDGVKATFKIISMRERMKEMKMEMPAGMKETHHIMVEFTDAKSGKNLSEGVVKVKIQGPDKAEQTKDLMGMPGMSGMGAGFGADLMMDKKGKYGVMCKFQLKDGKVRTAKFWYTVE
jgi:hypothetical protein